MFEIFFSVSCAGKRAEDLQCGALSVDLLLRFFGVQQVNPISPRLSQVDGADTSCSRVAHVPKLLAPSTMCLLRGSSTRLSSYQQSRPNGFQPIDEVVPKFGSRRLRRRCTELILYSYLSSPFYKTWGREPLVFVASMYLFFSLQ
jgi:hypothetical protein